MGVITTIDQLPSAPSALDGTEVTIAQTTTGETIQVTVQQLAEVAADLVTGAVASVNGFTGVVTLDAGDVGAVPAVTPAQPSAIDGDEVIVTQKGSTYVSITAQQIADYAALGAGTVTSVNGNTGAVVLDATDVSATPSVSAAGGQPSGLDGTEIVVVQKSGDYVQATLAQVTGLALQTIAVACSDETTALTTGTAKVTFHMPFAFALTEVIGGLTTAQTSGSTFTVDVNEAGTTIFSTKITIDNGEETSLTAAAPPVLSDTLLAKGAKITVDIDQIGDGTAKGLKVYLVGRPVI
jgi:hypothetical protein